MPGLKDEYNLSNSEILNIIKQAGEQDNPTLCNKISSLPAEVCDSIYDRSLKEQLDSKCYPRNNCIGSIITNRAANKKDISLCETVVAPDWNSECYSRLAVELKDVSLCKKAVYGVAYDDCLLEIAIAENNPKLCEKATTFNCYYQFARKLNQPEVCQSISLSEGNARYNCVLAASKDAEGCAGLPADWYDACIKQVQA